MRALRYLLLLGAAGIAFFAFRDYQLTRGARDAAPKVTPATLERGLNSRSSRWQWEQSAGDASRLMVSAEGFSQGRDDGAIELEGVELRIFRNSSHSFDLIRTEKAIFDVDANQLKSQTETFITLGVDAVTEDADAPGLTRIIAAEAVFDTRTGAAQTESATRYLFEGGEARSTGSFYDSAQGHFEMQSNVEVDRFSPGGGPTTHIQSGSLVYEEKADRVDLRDGVSMERDGRRVDAQSAVIHLENGKLRTILATEANGGDSGENRKTTFRTPNLEAYYDALQRLEKVVGSGASELTADSTTSTVRAAGQRVELRYSPDPDGGDSLLDEAFLKGGAEVLAVPKGGADAERRVTSESIRLEMRAGGEEIELLETLEPGRVELRPLDQGTARTLDAQRVRALYGPRSRLQRLEGRGEVSLTSRPPNGAPLASWSNILDAALSPVSGELTGLVQRGRFRFEQGERSGSAESAVWDPSSERLTMEGGSKIHDAAGRIEAHRIVLVEGGGRIEAQGGVSSVFEDKQSAESERPSPGQSGLFQSDQPVYATAARMESDGESGVVIYEGEARLWQGRNRIEADRIRIDRRGRTLLAEGKALSLLEEVREGDKEPSLVAVTAQRLHYEEGARRATYTDGVTLKRSDLIVHADELTARLRPANAGGGAGLESATAQGGVRIEEVAGARRATADTAELVEGQQRVVLRGAPARAWNEAGEETRGAELTWSSGNDSLRVSGGEERAYTFRRQGR